MSDSTTESELKPFTFEWWLKMYDRAVGSMNDAANIYDNWPLYEKNRDRAKWIRKRLLSKANEPEKASASDVRVNARVMRKIMCILTNEVEYFESQSKKAKENDNEIRQRVCESSALGIKHAMKVLKHNFTE